MASLGGPHIVTDGLVLSLDAANDKSFRGEPTTNLVTAPSVNGLSPIVLTYLGQEDGWEKYSISGTFVGGTYPYIMNIDAVAFTAGVQYTTRCTMRTNVLNKFNYFGTIGVNYVNLPLSISGVNRVITNTDGSTTVSREGFAYQNTTTQPGFLHTNPINNTTFNPSTDFIWVKDVQVEQKPYATPFVNGTRGTTVATGGGWADRTGNSNHGELVNGPTFDSANGGSIVFDGVNDFIDCGNSSSLNFGTGSFTINCWFRPSTLQAGGDFPALIEKSNGDFTAPSLGVTGWILLYITNGNQYVFRLGDSSTTINNLSFPLTVANDNIWKNLAVTVSPTTLIGYYNGVRIGSTTRTLTGSVNTSTNLNIGRWRAFTRELNTNISQVQIYNRALTAQEVEQNYNATKTRFGL